jgi:hypothetical protein
MFNHTQSFPTSIVVPKYEPNVIRGILLLIEHVWENENDYKYGVVGLYFHRMCPSGMSKIIFTDVLKKLKNAGFLTTTRKSLPHTTASGETRPHFFDRYRVSDDGTIFKNRIYNCLQSLSDLCTGPQLRKIFWTRIIWSYGDPDSESPMPPPSPVLNLSSTFSQEVATAALPCISPADEFPVSYAFLSLPHQVAVAAPLFEARREAHLLTVEIPSRAASAPKAPVGIVMVPATVGAPEVIDLITPLADALVPPAEGAPEVIDLITPLADAMVEGGHTVHSGDGTLFLDLGTP